MARKKYLTLPRIVTIRCRHCDKKSKRRVPQDSSPGFFDCDACGQRMTTPPSSCCIICAFTGKKCVPTLKMEARVKGLELR